MNFYTPACERLNIHVITDIAGPGVRLAAIYDPRGVITDCCTGLCILCYADHDNWMYLAGTTGLGSIESGKDQRFQKSNAHISE